MFIAIHDFERRYRALVLVLDLAQDSIDILGHGKLAQVGIDDRYRVWRNLVGEIGPGCGLHRCVGFEGDFVAHNPGTKRRIAVGRKRRERLSAGCQLSDSENGLQCSQGSRGTCFLFTNRPNLL